MSPDLFNKMFSLGGDWYNTGYGFESADHISLGYNGSYQSLNTLLDKYINIPEIVLTGNSSTWGSQAQGAFNSFMNNWYSNGGKANWFIGATGIGVDNFTQRFYIGTARRNAPVRFLGQNYYGNGRTFIKAAPIAGAIGRFSLGLGVVMDAKGVINYAENPNSPNAVHPGKASFNTVMGIIGYKGGAYGAIISTLYFGIDAFYPGGWVGASETAARTEAHEQQMTGHPFFSNSALKF